MAENMPGGHAQRPSDVITIFGGKTVEVLNTDAEGRLVLADALARSAEDAPDLVVDVATLTGAQVVALGLRISGVMASDDERRPTASSTRPAGPASRPGRCRCPRSCARGWTPRSPTSPTCPGTGAAGCWWLALFLREFVPDGVRWAHVDIAGPAFHEGEPYGYTPKGGTGAAVRMLVQIALDVADGTALTAAPAGRGSGAAGNRACAGRRGQRRSDKEQNVTDSSGSYDIVILGGGSGGYACALRAAELGKRSR